MLQETLMALPHCPHGRPEPASLDLPQIVLDFWDSDNPEERLKVVKYEVTEHLNLNDHPVDLHIFYDGGRKPCEQIAPFLEPYSHRIKRLTCHFDGNVLDAIMLSLGAERIGKTLEELIQPYTPYSAILDSLALLECPILEEFNIIDKRAGKLGLHIARDKTSSESLVFSPFLWKTNKWIPSNLTILRLLDPAYFDLIGPASLQKDLQTILTQSNIASSLEYLEISCIFGTNDNTKPDNSVTPICLPNVRELAVSFVQDPSSILHILRLPNLENLTLRDEVSSLPYPDRAAAESARNSQKLPGLLDYISEYGFSDEGNSLKHLSLHGLPRFPLDQTFGYIENNLTNLECLSLSGHNRDSNAVDSFAWPLFTDYYDKYIKSYNREDSPPVLLPKLQNLFMTNYGLERDLDFRGFRERRCKLGVPPDLSSLEFNKKPKPKGKDIHLGTVERI